ncbi:MAG: peptidylprolyl isomerase [Sedimentisphaerales bacterium]|nr:peptidylprolyl isomerase [Sedimentisphaerales bacterium]
MTRKYWTCGLLTAVILIGGCADSVSKTKNERNAVNSDSNIVKLETSMGDIVIELDRQAAPVTTANFLEYTSEGFYDGTIFHRVIRGFMIQGGGFPTDMVQKKARDPIVNEAKNGLSNKRGTIAMARQNDPDSATCQFFINHGDNTPLDSVGGGYAVFGKVIEGMEVVDTIAAVKTTARSAKVIGPNGRHIETKLEDVPAEPVVIKSATIIPE